MSSSTWHQQPDSYPTSRPQSVQSSPTETQLGTPIWSAEAARTFERSALPPSKIVKCEPRDTKALNTLEIAWHSFARVVHRQFRNHENCELPSLLMERCDGEQLAEGQQPVHEIWKSAHFSGSFHQQCDSTLGKESSSTAKLG